MSKNGITSYYIDGVIELHKQLRNTHQQAKELSKKIFGSSTNSLIIFVDFSEVQPDNQLKGYFVFKGFIQRFLPITFDIALLFPVKDHGYNKKMNGITYKEILEKKRNGKAAFIIFRYTYTDEVLHHMSIRDIESLRNTSFFRLDDLGMPVYEFPDIDYINIINVPSIFLEKKYTLVGKRFYAPYSTDNEAYCVLFAELDNEYDEHAIKVLRWLPANKGVEFAQLAGLEPKGGDVFFELGYISKQENSELHNFMTENNSRILFGKIKGEQITVLGGVKMFLFNEFKYPKCLYNIELK